MRILIATHKHGLLPFAWRLKKEGHDVEVLVFKDRYEKAWSGMFPKAITGKEKNRESLGKLAELATAGEFAVLTDSLRGQEVFGGAKFLFGTRGAVENNGPTEPPTGLLAVGGWFSGEGITPGTIHLLIRDLGLWPGGLGPSVTGGVTLVRTVPRAFQEFLSGAVLDELKSQDFRGLFSVDVATGPGGEPVAGKLAAGWSGSPTSPGFLHSHAFVSDLADLGEVIAGENGRLLSEYVVALPVSIPPFPSVSNRSAEEVEVKGLEASDFASVFFHDFYTKEKYEVWTGGLDGLIAVVRGSSQNFHLARELAVTKAFKMMLPEKQFRADVGLGVPSILAMLEANGYGV